jgi:ABC-2 type transport system permease protein
MSVLAELRWSLRREVWENRALWVAPLLIAGLVVFGFLMNSPALIEKWRGLEALAEAKRQARAYLPFGLAASAVLVTGWIVGVFYAVDALYGERRDRSVLFWKSMPVSDLVTVLAKAAIALGVLPLTAFAIALATQALMLILSSAVLAAMGLSAGTLWSVPWFQATLVFFYGVVVHILWFAPVYAWLLMVSAWARRSPFLWAFLPFFAAYAVETVAFGTRYVGAFLRYRVGGAMARAFPPGDEPVLTLSQVEPMRFLATPGLWLGLAFAALCLTAAVRIRRYRDPI